MDGLVTVAKRDDITVVTIDNPPVNATSTAVRGGLMQAIAQAQGSALAVLHCAGKTFVAGGDMTEFDAPPEPPHLPDVTQALEDSTTPFLAMMHGTVLGGGFELAMACAYRVAAPGTRFGLPEVNLGLIPGAGGTQRAPRLIGWEAAVEMACLGKLMSAEDLLALGALDAIEAELERAIDAVRDRPIRPVSTRQVSPPDDATWQALRKTVTSRAKGQTAPLLALDALSWAAQPFATGQPKERAAHLALRDTDQSRALRHIFFAERATPKAPAFTETHPRSIEVVTILGGGLMGCGIAAACLSAGLSVTLLDRDQAIADDAAGRIGKILDGAITRKRMTEGQRTACMNRLTTGSRMELAAGCDMVIEAVFEDLDTKRAAFDALSRTVGPDTILATNTSYLDPRAIFDGQVAPDRCLGLHFFAPAHVMKLVEVVRTPQTAPEVLATGAALAKRLDKIPVLSGICDGFIGNRILAAYRRAAEYLLADGALPEQIDAAMRAFGMAMGPFEAQDMGGLQIAEANRRRQDATRNPAERYVPIADRLCAAGRLGRGSGAGWYRYETGDSTPRPDPEVTALIEAYSREAGLRRHAVTTEEIQVNLLAAMANEGACIVEDGIADTTAAVDVVKVAGYGFPRWRGGPMHWAETVGADVIADTLTAMDRRSPQSWRRAARFQPSHRPKPPKDTP